MGNTQAHCVQVHEITVEEVIFYAISFGFSDSDEAGEISVEILRGIHKQAQLQRRYYFWHFCQWQTY